MIGKTVATNYRARTYDPQTGRFMQRDPLGINPAGGSINSFKPIDQYKDGLNCYQYVRSNSINYTDPQGLGTYEWGGLKWDSKTCTMCRFPKSRKKLACAMRSASNSCGAIDAHITDPDLAACMKRKCEKTKIKCSTATPTGVGGNSAGLGSIDIYPNNYGPDGTWGEYTPGDVVVHEFAEKCGWKHHQGKGVPDPEGDIVEDLQSGASSWGIKCN